MTPLHPIFVHFPIALLVTAAVKKDNVIGLQFHPEKSGEAGLIILKSFVNR